MFGELLDGYARNLSHDNFELRSNSFTFGNAHASMALLSLNHSFLAILDDDALVVVAHGLPHEVVTSAARGRVGMNRGHGGRDVLDSDGHVLGGHGEEHCRHGGQCSPECLLANYKL